MNFSAAKDFAAATSERKTWEKVRKMLGGGLMPPSDHQPQPKEAESAAVLAWVERVFFQVDCGRARDPGHVTIRRLNRNEYNCTVRDLIGVSITPADEFPSDDVGNGFDNMGDVLSLSPLLMEKYLAAAERITSIALFGVDTRHPPAYQFDAPALTAHGAAEMAQKLFGASRYYLIPSAGSVSLQFTAPRTGDYRFIVLACARQAEGEAARMELHVDGNVIRTFDVKGDLEPATYEIHVRLPKGDHRLAARFANCLVEPSAPPLPVELNPRRAPKKGRGARRVARELVVQRFEVEGPSHVDPDELSAAATEARKRLLFCMPGKDGTVRECATRILSRFAPRSFRRPVGPDELAPYVDLVVATAESNPFDRAVQAGLTALLVSPHFLFRVEQPGSAGEGTEPVPIGSYELASRLSYFLWSSMPDDELFALASAGRLAQRDVLEGQVRRMLQDAKSRALVAYFAGQWLNLAQLDVARPNADVFKEFNEDLRCDMRRETELFFESVVREDRSVFDFLNGRYTFLNDRLAKHYGIGGVKGAEFRRVALDGYSRAGLLTQGSILTLTSQKTRTSPVKRGKWILENLLGSPPPPPPANVPELAAAEAVDPKATLRVQMEIHRKSSACSVCHKVMDPLGFGLENFDGIGRWREKDRDRPVDASGKLPNGESFRGPIELVDVLSRRADVFREHLARTVLTYALGRGLEYYDKCAIDRIVDELRRGGDRFSVLANAIVESEPFLLRRGGSVKHGQ